MTLTLTAAPALPEQGSAVALRPTWMRDAACQYTDAEVFFPPAGGSPLPARRICHRCPVAAQCLRWALSTKNPDGVLGGHTPNGRRILAAAIRAWAAEVQLLCPPSGPVPTGVQDAYYAAITQVAA